MIESTIIGCFMVHHLPYGWELKIGVYFILLAATAGFGQLTA